MQNSYRAWSAVSTSSSGRDYASYHYAVKSAWNNDSPYDLEKLDQLARIEGTRQTVHPFFYPPPALLTIWWIQPFSLAMGYKLFYWFNQFCLFLSLWNLKKWLKTSWMELGGITIALTPIFDSMKMGQLNLFIVLLLILMMRYRSGWALSVAAMSKMAPALLFFQALMLRQWKMLWTCIVGCLLLSLLSLLFVDFSTQWYFYSKILPSFSSGEYHGLSIPISLPANHSIPDLCNQLYPSHDPKVLSIKAAKLSKLINVSVLLILLYASKKWSCSDSDKFLNAAMICLMLLFPVYCYEHHLALLLVPVTIMFHGLKQNKHITNKQRTIVWMTVFFGGMPLFALRAIQRILPDVFSWPLQESKFFFIVWICALCLWLARGCYLDNIACNSLCSEGDR